jgi:hypothetical protein
MTAGFADKRDVNAVKNAASRRTPARRVRKCYRSFVLGVALCFGVSAAGTQQSAAQAGRDAATQVRRDASPPGGENQTIPTKFRVKFVRQDVVYLEGGRQAGLAEGQRLRIRRDEPANATNDDPGTADVRIISVASASAAAEILSSSLDVQPGDTAYLSEEDVYKLKLLAGSKDTRKYPQVITFTEGDPMDEEVREYLPRPPLPEVNRVRGRMGFEYNSIHTPGSGGMSSSQFGIVMRTDMTRIAGSYWNLSGYYRGRFTSQTPTGQATLTDLLNRTYHLSLSYNNPNSHWTAGFGRLYLPWASSLGTIDGGYVGRHYGKVTFGLFGGSAPDPTSWRYAPNRQMGGGFFNVEGGSFESFRYMTTFGAALTRVDWNPDRQFAFCETALFYKRYLSIYHGIEIDQLRGDTSMSSQNSAPADSVISPAKGPVVSRDYLTIRIQPHRVISFDMTENYFRNIPTFDARLIASGLLDKVLFQGLSGAVRVELPGRISPYASIGRSHSDGDGRISWNKMFGISWGNILHSGIRTDLRYSKFDSSFGSGSYKTLMFSRQIGEKFRFDIQAGQQDLRSAYSNESRARWLTGTFDWFLGRHLFLGASFTRYQGTTQDYDQRSVNLGYRF